jgi:hypothetical protein
VLNDLTPHNPIWKVAWASATGSIINTETQSYFQWEPRKQLLPLNTQLKAYFKSKAYQNISQDFKKDVVYRIDEDRLVQEINKLDNPPVKF